jgi:hypothetical protein
MTKNTLVHALSEWMLNTEPSRKQMDCPMVTLLLFSYCNRVYHETDMYCSMYVCVCNVCMYVDFVEFKKQKKKKQV